MQSFAQKPYRARQVWEALYRQRVASVEDMTTLSQELRERLMTAGWSVGLPGIVQTARSVDGTERYLMRMADGETVETVWMPDGDGGERGDGSEAAEEEAAETVDAEEAVAGAQDAKPGYWERRGNGRPKSSFGTLAEKGYRRATICISSQVGCAVNCQFCLTALLGVKRNLSAGEIVGQVLATLAARKVSPPQDRGNLVFMGMGEPFLNYDNFMKAVRLLVEEVGIPELRMTVSTAGIVPRIFDLGQEKIRPKLAISLNASNDETRSRLMPINRKWNLEKLMAAARQFPLRNRERMTFEYVLLEGVNDSRDNAQQVAELIRGTRAKMNLIA